MANIAMVTTILGWIPRLAILLIFGGIISAVWLFFPEVNLWFAIFCTFFVIRYTRFLGHVIGHFMYQPSPISLNPRYLPSDVTVIVPTVDPNNSDFRECIASILANQVASLVVVTVGPDLKDDCVRTLQTLAPYSEGTSIYVSAISRPSKRRQIAHAMSDVHTPITILADDHVFWSPRFVTSVLAPFEDEQVGAVATKKRVRRVSEPCKFSWPSIVNFVAQNYLERHNWELRATLDGAPFVISGRTAVYKTGFLVDHDLMSRFCSERFFFGLFGKEGLGSDDDNFLTRNLLAQGLKIKFQDTEEATIETTLGEWPKFNGQLLRWARTTFRSNPVMLRQPMFWVNHTWSAGMIYLAGITNFAIVWDTLLIASLVMSLKADESKLAFLSVGWLVLFILYLITTKLWKILPALLRTPSDCALIPIQIAFAYIHSFYKLWALLTFWDCDWSGRNLDEINAAENGQAGIVLDDLATVEVLV